MATQRYISTSFWDDAWVQSNDPSEKLMYLYLMTNPLTNIAGIYKITDKRIHDDTGFNVDMVHKLLDRFATAKKAYREGEYIIIPKWPKHQKWTEKKTIETGIRKIISELPKSIRDKAIKVGYLYPIDTVPISYPYSPSYSDSDIDSDIDRDAKEESANAPILKEGKHKYGEDANVLLTDSEFDKLKKEYGDVRTVLMIRELSDYKAMSGHKYASDYRAIKKWVAEKVIKAHPSEPVEREIETVVVPPEFTEMMKRHREGLSNGNV